MAKHLVVDELSLIREVPVRVKGRCRNPTSIKGSIQVFFNGTGVFIRFKVEDNKGKANGGNDGPLSA